MITVEYGQMRTKFTAAENIHSTSKFKTNPKYAIEIDLMKYENI